jgi:hypothetical protein
LIEEDPRNADRIFPYLGGDELNTSPIHAHHRYVINFAQMTESEARRWPGLMEVVERTVKPERAKLRDNADGRRRKKIWWQWGRYTPALYETIRGMPRVLAASRHQPHWCTGFLATGSVFSEALIVFAFTSNAAFAVLQSRPHEVWARFFGSSMKDDLRYTPSDCFETFPFPEGWETCPAIEAVGKAYYDFRAALMVKNDEGLTTTYNRFHDPDERSSEILRLRELHAEMDRSVLDSYRWSDVPTACEFFLDHVDAADEDDAGGKKKKRKPYHYRWPDEVRDEVLSRLIELNRVRAEGERKRGVAVVRRAIEDDSEDDAEEDGEGDD